MSRVFILLSLLLVGCDANIGDFNKERAAAHKKIQQQYTDEVERAHVQITKCRDAGLDPEIVWGSEWLFVTCRFPEEKK